MKIFDDYPAIRIAAILICFVTGLILVYTGWLKTGILSGLIQMIIGVGILLVALAIYNYPYRDRK